ncbi:tetraacyldisaccharide 4'-kinase [Janthinobacterium sp. CG_23.3]|uniref:tetraacyldisaccharide 4'-kinase n=1 Tax=unclassified Janthinobacterium TaxID=2610881 RepID=UPI00034DB226|nr:MULTISPECIES: tetraacyldisaccharide 4'-kinase [unclassified Janthinobacterium]MEC5163495.1 tetraacyldisaccharide 4'-kinase [Janthinobacterium sp. CG_S6]
MSISDPLVSPVPPQPSSLEATLSRAWLRRGPLACALWPLSLLFGALSAGRAALYRSGRLKSTRLPVPVVVVGNIFIGGTGKTPLTIWLVQALREQGMTPGVVSRGHGGKDSLPRLVTAESRARDVGDEPLLIAGHGRCPVVVGRDRAAAGRALLAAHPEVDVLITDDGLQHYALQRDVEIVLFDGRGVGNGWLLPAGPLREPATRRRDFTVVNAAQLPAALRAAVGGAQAAAVQMHLGGDYAERLVNRAERLPLTLLAGEGRRIAAAAGIGHPERFFSMLEAKGLRFARLPLPDHHDFLDRPFDAVDADLILITEKDAVKCAQIEHLKDDPRLWVVPVTARIDAALAQHIVEKCRGHSTA